MSPGLEASAGHPKLFVQLGERVLIVPLVEKCDTPLRELLLRNARCHQQ